MHAARIIPENTDNPAETATREPDLATRARTFRRLVTGMVLFGGHVLVILVILDLAFRW